MTDQPPSDPGDDDARLRALLAAFGEETDPQKRSNLHAKIEMLKIDVAGRRRGERGDVLGDDAEAGGP